MTGSMGGVHGINTPSRRVEETRTGLRHRMGSGAAPFLKPLVYASGLCWSAGADRRLLEFLEGLLQRFGSVPPTRVVLGLAQRLEGGFRLLNRVGCRTFRRDNCEALTVQGGQDGFPCTVGRQPRRSDERVEPSVGCRGFAT